MTFLVIGVLLILFTLGMGMINRMTSEARWVKRIIRGEICTVLAEAVIEEMVWHFRSSMNKQGSGIYSGLRQPTPNNFKITFEKANLLVTDAILKQEYGEISDSAVKVEAFLSVEDTQPFGEDPNSEYAGLQPAEKKGTVRFHAKVGIGGVVRKLEILKDVKVVNLSPPPPLHRWVVWLKKDEQSNNSTVALPKEVVFNNTPNDPLTALSEKIQDLPQDIATKIAQFFNPDKSKIHNWRFKWAGQTHYNSYPFCREKVSHYFKTFQDYILAMCDVKNKVFFLDGLIVINDKKTVKLTGRYKNKGTIVSRKSKINSSGLYPLGDSLLNLVVLDNSQIRLMGNTGSTSSGGTSPKPFLGGVYTPQGYFVTRDNTNISGQVFAFQWKYKKFNRVEIADAFKDAAAPTYFATLSHQIILWQEGAQ